MPAIAAQTGGRQRRAYDATIPSVRGRFENWRRGFLQLYLTGDGAVGRAPVLIALGVKALGDYHVVGNGADNAMLQREGDEDSRQGRRPALRPLHELPQGRLQDELQGREDCALVIL